MATIQYVHQARPMGRSIDVSPGGVNQSSAGRQLAWRPNELNQKVETEDVRLIARPANSAAELLIATTAQAGGDAMRDIFDPRLRGR